ncbi:MAG TPA: hypothetical protein VFX76_08810, partial [Roseiflexaceae bacterium]|nr:hypothetical protein [Roseiflexaceae bacterium]
SDRIRPIVFHPTQPLLFTGALDDYLRVWNLETGEMVMEVADHNAGSNGSIDLSADGTLLAFARRGGAASIVTWPQFKEVHQFKTTGREALSIQFNADATQVAFTGRGDYLGLFDVRSGELIATPPASSMVWNTEFSPDGQTLYGGIWTKEVFKWDLRSPTKPPMEFTGHNGLVSDVQTRPGDPRILASASTDGALKLWDTRTGNCLATITPFGGWEVITACFSPDGKRLAATGSNGEAAIYDLHYYDAFIEGNREYQERKAGVAAGLP